MGATNMDRLPKTGAVPFSNQGQIQAVSPSVADFFSHPRKPLQGPTKGFSSGPSLMQAQPSPSQMPHHVTLTFKKVRDASWAAG